MCVDEDEDEDLALSCLLIVILKKEGFFNIFIKAKIGT